MAFTPCPELIIINYLINNLSMSSSPSVHYLHFQQPTKPKSFSSLKCWRCCINDCFFLHLQLNPSHHICDSCQCDTPACQGAPFSKVLLQREFFLFFFFFHLSHRHSNFSVLFTEFSSWSHLYSQIATRSRHVTEFQCTVYLRSRRKTLLENWGVIQRRRGSQ